MKQLNDTIALELVREQCGDEIEIHLRDRIIELEAGVERLKKVVSLKDRYIERMGFCPDCRNKVGGKCFRCENQRLCSALKERIELLKREGCTHRGCDQGIHSAQCPMDTVLVLEQALEDKK